MSAPVQGRPGPILPGATIGILGGGQLGRMTAMAARSLGYHVHALDPDPSCASRHVVERCITAPFDDDVAAAYLAKSTQVVTLEIEKVSLEALAAAARHAPVRPGPEVLRIIQDRIRQKTWLAENGFPLGPWRKAESEAQLGSALGALTGPFFVKTSFGGYDGGGQAQLQGASEAGAAWRGLGEHPVVVEQALELEAELSVLVARSPSGQVAVHPPALNHHVKRVLEWSVLPGPMPEPVRKRAVEIAHALATTMKIEGLLVVELFLTRDGQLYVNELAPRPHNSFHATEVGSATSQFEQLVRAVCDLPLGSTETLRPAAIANLLGDLWVGDQSPRFDRALALPGVRLHLYGKRVARPGRKMGHLSALGNTPEQAVALVREAKARLSTEADVTIEAVRGDITTLEVDAIVNAANSALSGGGGVDGAIHRAAGPELLAACRKLNRCPTGEAVRTPGFRLKARWVIHAVGPVWQGGAHRERELLASAYAASFARAIEETSIRTIAFPAISSGIYGFPKDEAARIAIGQMRAHDAKFDRIIACAFDEETFQLYRRELGAS